MLEEMLRPLRRYADFSGRARRREYWLFILLNWLVFGAASGVGIAFGWKPWDANGPRLIPGANPPAIDWIMLGVWIVLTLAFLLPWLAVQVRRFHDRERSAWLLLWHLVPYFGTAVIIAYMLLPGDPDPNFYGPAPGDPLGTRLSHS
jgi:uncharacterized membrane protein YhaH (DUF805 family)